MISPRPTNSDSPTIYRPYQQPSTLLSSLTDLRKQFEHVRNQNNRLTTQAKSTKTEIDRLRHQLEQRDRDIQRITLECLRLKKSKMQLEMRCEQLEEGSTQTTQIQQLRRQLAELDGRNSNIQRQKEEIEMKLNRMAAQKSQVHRRLERLIHNSSSKCNPRAGSQSKHLNKPEHVDKSNRKGSSRLLPGVQTRRGDIDFLFNSEQILELVDTVTIKFSDMQAQYNLRVGQAPVQLNEEEFLRMQRQITQLKICNRRINNQVLRLEKELEDSKLLNQSVGNLLKEGDVEFNQVVQNLEKEIIKYKNQLERVRSMVTNPSLSASRMAQSKQNSIQYLQNAVNSLTKQLQAKDMEVKTLQAKIAADEVNNRQRITMQQIYDAIAKTQGVKTAKQLIGEIEQRIRVLGSYEAKIRRLQQQLQSTTETNQKLIAQVNNTQRMLGELMDGASKKDSQLFAMRNQIQMLQAQIRINKQASTQLQSSYQRQMVSLEQDLQKSSSAVNQLRNLQKIMDNKQLFVDYYVHSLQMRLAGEQPRIRSQIIQHDLQQFAAYMNKYLQNPAPGSKKLGKTFQNKKV